MIGIKTEVSPEFKRTAQRFQYSSRQIVGDTMARLVSSAATAAKKEAQNQLMSLVYNAKLPDSVSDSAAYLETRRTGRAFRAVTKDPVKVAGMASEASVRVAKENFDDYYYALILNYGGRGINYRARPFWTNTERTMRARFLLMGRLALKSISAGLAAESSTGFRVE